MLNNLIKLNLTSNCCDANDMKKIILYLIRRPAIASAFLPLILKLHTLLYDLISIMVVSAHGTHPKHEILRYEAWFADQVDRDDVVLDVGCNQGGLIKELSKKVTWAYGIEIHEKHLVVARQNTPPNVEFICADATTFDYSKLKPITVMTLSNVLEHIQDRPRFLSMVIKTIKWKDKPKLLIRVPTIERDWLPVYKKSVGIEYRLDKTHFVEHTFMQFESELNQVGLNILSFTVRFGEFYAVVA